MTNDLFQKPQSMRQRVLDFCSKREFTTSIDIERLKDEIKAKEGMIKGLMRIHREFRELAEDGTLERLSRNEKLHRGFNPKFCVCRFKKKDV